MCTNLGTIQTWWEKMLLLNLDITSQHIVHGVFEIHGKVSGWRIERKKRKVRECEKSKCKTAQALVGIINLSHGC